MLDIKKYAMIVGITILFATLVLVTIDAFYPEPMYDDFCKSGQFARPYPVYEKTYPASSLPAAQTNCTDVLLPNKESQECERAGGFIEFDYDEKGCQVKRSMKCNYCNKEFNDYQKKYNRNVFFISAPIGLVAIFFGVLWTIDFLGSGFMFGGIAVLAIGTTRYFGDMSKWMRVFTIFIELVLLIWIGYKKLASPEERKKSKIK